jgi:N-acetyl-gamma-glutamyl-phosphate reductase
VSAKHINAAVVGATGYTGVELVRSLARHPHVGGLHLFVREQAEASDLAQHYPQFSGNGALPLESFAWEKLEQRGVSMLFLATPHEASRAWAPEAVQRGLRVVDLSGAWRLKNAAHRAVYGFTEPAPLDEQAVYGIPELRGAEMADAALVANAGCYATSVILPLVPLLRAGLVDRGAGVVCDSKSGVSGAGKQPTDRTHFVHVAENLSAYSVFAHRHTGEMLEQLGLEAGELTFTPHLLPIARGILSTIYVKLTQPVKASDIEGVLRQFYRGRHWVRIFGAARLPEIRHSAHTNYCDIGFALDGDGRRLVLVSCLDNLLKGASGQAVQNMNLMYGWDEKAGLA